MRNRTDQDPDRLIVFLCENTMITGFPKLNLFAFLRDCRNYTCSHLLHRHSSMRAILRILFYMSHKCIVFFLFLLSPAHLFGNWSSDNGPIGAEGLIVAGEPDNVYALGTSGYLYHSGDSCKTWTLRSSPKPNGIITCFDAQKDVLVVGTNGYALCSYDGGFTWRSSAYQTSALPVHSDVWSVAVLSSAVMYTEKGKVVISLDSGKTWEGYWSQNPPDLPIREYNGKLFSASSEHGCLLRSNDTGKTWTRDYVNESPGPFLSMFGLVDSNQLFLGHPILGLRISSDGGESWERAVGLPDTITACTIGNNSAGTLIGVKSPAGTWRVFKTEDSGRSWSEVGMLSHGECTSIVPLSPKTFLYTNWNIVYLFDTDSGEERNATSGIAGTSPLYLAQWDSHLAISAIEGFHVLKQGNPEIEFASYPEFGYSPYTVSTGDAGVYLATRSGVYLKKAPESGHWRNLSEELWPGAALANRSFAVAEHGGFVFMDRADSVFRVDPESGYSEALFEHDPIWFHFANYPIWFHSQQTDLFFCMYQKLQVTRDSGSTWNPVLENEHVRAMCSIGSSLAAYLSPHGIALSHDNGRTWTTPASPVNMVNDLEYGHGLLFAASGSSGVMVSSDSGMTWNEINAGLPTKTIRSLELVDSTLYAGTLGQGLWEMRIQADLLAGNRHFRRIGKDNSRKIRRIHLAKEGLHLYSNDAELFPSFDCLGRKLQSSPLRNQLHRAPGVILQEK